MYYNKRQAGIPGELDVIGLKISQTSTDQVWFDSALITATIDSTIYTLKHI